MYTHILVGTDGSELAGRAVEHAVKLAAALKAELTFVTVTEPWAATTAGAGGVAFPVDDYNKGVAAFANRALDAANEAARAAGVTAHLIHLADQFPSEGLVQVADNKGCDLIVVASHGRKGLARLVLGGETYRLVTESKRPVLVIK